MKEVERSGEETHIRRISGFDLFACKARYHKSCRMQYLQRPEKWRSTSDDQINQQSTLEEVLNKDVMLEKKVLKLTDLKQVYVSTFQDSPVPNTDYRSKNPKTKLEWCEKYKGNLAFCPIGDES